MKYAFLFAACATCSTANAQHALITEHALGDPPPLPQRVTTMSEQVVALRRTGVQEIVEENGSMVEYMLVHTTLYLRDDAAIEQENKVYVNLDDALNVVRCEARSISPDGTVQTLDKDAFKRATDEDKNGNYLYFAFEGLVPGSIVDYYHILKTQPHLQGDGYTMQLGVPIIHEDFHLLHPTRLVYRTKGYNGLPEPSVDSSITDVLEHHWELTDVPALENETSANLGAARMRVSFKVDRVPDKNMKDVSSYINATKMYYAALHPAVEGKAAKELKALMGRMKLEEATDDVEKVRRVEDHLKNNFQIVTANAPELSDFASMLHTKVCNQRGMVALTSAVLDGIGVENQFVITSDRTRMPFDKDFESFQYLEDIALYLPGPKLYLDPVTPGLRLGFLKSEDMANNALFIRSFEVGGTSTGVGSVKYIAALPDSVSASDHIITARLSPEGDRADIDFEERLSGYFASIQCFYPLLSDEKKAKVRNELVDYLLENGEVTDLTALNDRSILFGQEPFIVKGHVSTRKFNASAGEKMLFKVGELIGPQTEMYTDKPRKLPVDDDYNRRFDRTIDVVLPAGWTVQNMADLNIDHHLDMAGVRQLAFISNATLEGDTVKIRVTEFYRACQLPLEQFEPYRSVVNAAADFNKIALILVKG